jgi:hypothetical protein
LTSSPEFGNWTLVFSFRFRVVGGQNSIARNVACSWRIANYAAQQRFREAYQAFAGPDKMSQCVILSRIIHEAFTAAADPGMPAALRSVGFLDVLSSTPAESSLRAPCIHARLRRLATNLHE